MAAFGRVGRGRTTAAHESAHDDLAPGEVLDVTPARAGLTPVGEWPDSSNGAAKRPDNAPTSAAFAGVCRYFHDCFAADARGGVLTNVLDKHQAEYLTFADSVEVLLTGQIDRLEVNLSTGVTAQNAADVTRRVKFLIYGSIFLVGRGRASGNRRGELYCAPLLYWPAHIEQEGTEAFMSLDM